MGNSVNLPAPYKGVSESVPQAAIKMPHCYNLYNFNTTREGVSVRHGDTSFANVAVSNLAVTKVLGKYGNTALFVLVYDTVNLQMKVYNSETDALVYTSAASGFGQFQPQFFNKYLYFFSSTAAYKPGIRYNSLLGWGPIGYTEVSGSTATFSPRGGGNNYNHRNYIIQMDEPGYWYSGTDKISGDVTYIDLSGIVSEHTTLANIASITLSDQISTVQLQCFCMANGEILFYSGSYPDGDDWSAQGTAKVGQLVSYYNSVFQYQGDAIILSDNGIASLRDLFLKGSSAAVNLSVNNQVQRTWQYLIKEARTIAANPDGPISASITGVWDEINSRLYIHLPFAYTPFDPASFSTVGNFWFVFDTVGEAWFFHTSRIPGQISFSKVTYYKGKVILLTDNVNNITLLHKEGSTGFMDRNNFDSFDAPYNFDLITAPIPFQKTNINAVEGIEPIIISDLYFTTNYKLIGDLGRQTTNDQPIEDQGTSVAKPLANVGLKNSTLNQVQVSGQSSTGKTIGLSLYSFNVWYDSGDKGSR